MRNNHIAVPLCPTNTAAVHCAVPIAPTSSVATDIGATFKLFDSLVLTRFNWLRARSRVSRDTNPTISVKRLLTATSRLQALLDGTSSKLCGKRYRLFTILLEVNVSVLIVTCKAV